MISEWVAVRGVGGRTGTDGEYSKGAGPVEREFLFKDFIVGLFPRSLSDGGGGVIDPDPSTRYIFGAAEEGVREGGVATVNAGDRQSVLLAHEFICSLLSVAGEVAVGELVAVKALVSTTV